MKKSIAKILSLAMAVNGFYGIQAYAQSLEGVTNIHNCVVTKKGTGEQIAATCGMKVDPKDGVLRHFRQFNYGGLVHQQYLIPGQNGAPDQVHDITLQKVETQQSTTTTNAYERPQGNEDEGMSTMSKVLIVGGAVVATVGAIFGVRAIYKSGRRSAENEQENYRRGYRAGANARPAELSDMPNQVTLGKDVPQGAGQTVRVAGAVNSSQVPASVPRFQTNSGQTYIVQQNPNTGFLETILLYDMLTRPYYYPGAYAYPSFGYSPWLYGPNETVVINNDVVRDSSNLQYQTDTYTSKSNEEFTSTTTTDTTTYVPVADTVTPVSADPFSGGAFDQATSQPQVDNSPVDNSQAYTPDPAPAYQPDPPSYTPDPSPSYDPGPSFDPGPSVDTSSGW